MNGMSHNRPASVFRWRADDGRTLNAGLVALGFSGDPDQYCKETLYFCDFQGGSGPPAPSGSAHVMLIIHLCWILTIFLVTLFFLVIGEISYLFMFPQIYIKLDFFNFFTLIFGDNFFIINFSHLCSR